MGASLSHSGSAHDALGRANDAILDVVTDIDRGRVGDLPTARQRLTDLLTTTGTEYDRFLGAERRLVLTTEAATLRKAAEAVRALSPAAAGRLLAEAAAVEARLDLVPDHLRRPIEAVLGHRVGARLSDADALRIYAAMQDDADLPEEAASYLETYEAVRRLAVREAV